MARSITGGSAIILSDSTKWDFDASEHVQVFLGTQLTGTLLATATATSLGTVKATVPVPQVSPGSYLITAYGLQSTHWYTAVVPICPIARPSATQGSSGTAISLSGSGFQPGEPISVYSYYSSTQHPGILQSTTTADSIGSFIWATAVLTGTPGQVEVAVVGALSHAVYFFYFTILPALEVSSVPGTVGTVLTTTGSGYGTKYPQAGVWFGSLSTRIGLTMTNGAGGFAMYTSTVPTAAAKTYTVYGALYYRAAVPPYGVSWFTVVPASTPSIAIEGLGVTPSGLPGGPLTIGGVGWTAGHTISFTWGTLSVPTMTLSATTTVGNDGSFVATVPLPTAAQATWYVRANDGSTVVKAPYRISYTPHMALAETMGVAGQSQTLTLASGGGFAPGETVSVTLKSPKGVVMSNQRVAATATGDVWNQGVQFSLPATAVTGTYSVVATGLASKASVTAQYKVTVLTPSLALSPAFGPPGAAVTAMVTGFAASEVVYILYNTNLQTTGWVTLGYGITKQPPRGSTITTLQVYGLTIPPTGSASAAVKAVGGTSGASAVFTFTLPAPTSTPTAAASNTPVPSNTAVPPTNTAVPPTNTPSDTATNTPSDTATNTPSDTATNTPSDTPTNTPTDTVTNTPVTQAGGSITSDTEWTLGRSPYYVTSNVYVPRGVTLTIDPGVLVLFSPNTGLRVAGTLVAQGTADQQITFTSLSTQSGTGTEGDWASVSFLDGAVGATLDGSGNYLSGSIIEYARVLYGGGDGAPGALQIGNTSPYVGNVTVEDLGGGRHVRQERIAGDCQCDHSGCRRRGHLDLRGRDADRGRGHSGQRGARHL